MLFSTNYSVVELSAYIRQSLEGDYHLQDIWVTGEVSNMTRASSGHYYFTLKESTAQVKGVMWSSSARRLAYIPGNGDAVVAHGRISTYEGRSEYQLITDNFRPVGIGDLYMRFEQLKAKLEAEGLFAVERKRPLPIFPRQIGVVTSPEAAAFQDVQNVLRRRFPLAQVILSPTPVQGEGAPPLIVAALERLNAYTNVDVILLCRGGGSIEDLWAFNDERVARAVAASRIPVITGVGHETDFTIVDFVSDYRAPTPSAAAEIITPDIEDLRARVREMELNITTLVRNDLAELQSRLATTRRTLGHFSPVQRIATLRQRLDEWNSRMVREQAARVDRYRERLENKMAALHAANPQAILARGYAIVTHTNGQRIKSVNDAAAGEDILIQLHDGQLNARIGANREQPE